MKRYLLIFLICTSFASGESINWVVGGTGTGSEADADYGGHYDADVTTWGASMKGDGEVLGTDPTAVSSNDGGLVRLTSDGGEFDDAVAGVGVNVDFVQNESSDGRYIITAVGGVTPDTWIKIDASFGGDGENAEVWVGGALAEPGDILNDADVAGGSNGLREGDKVWVRAVKDYTLVDESDSIVYVTQAGTATAPIIWEAHFAEVSNEKGDFGIATLNANGKTNAIETAIGGAVYHVFIGFSLENATDDGANLNGVDDDNVVFVRCQFINNGAWGVQGDNLIKVAFCDFDTNTSGGLDCDNSSVVIDSVFRNNTGMGATFLATAINNLVYDNTGSRGLVGTVDSLFYGNTVDQNNQAASIGILQDAAAAWNWFAINNILTDCPTGLQDDAAIRQALVAYNNLYNSNTTDASANITPQPTDGDNWGNVVDPTNLFSSGYILHADNKGKGVDASYTKAYWDDFNGGAGDNPPSPLTGLSFMDMGGLQREEAGGVGPGTTSKSGGKQ